MKTVIWVGIFLAGLSLGAGAQEIKADTSLEYSALCSIYGYHFDVYQQQLRLLPGNKPFERQLLEVFMLRWKSIPVAFSKEGDQYRKKLLDIVMGLNRKSASSPADIFYKICANLFLAEYHAQRGENWSALKYGKDAYPMILEVFKQHYNNPEFLFIQGLYLYYVEYYKQKNFFYRMALSTLRPGDKKKGLDLLRQGAEKPSLVQIEARIFMAHILIHYENEPLLGLNYSKAMISQFPLNLKLMELYCDNLIRCEMHSLAVPYVETLQRQTVPYFSVPGHFFMGQIKEVSGKEKDKAIWHYQQCVKQPYQPVARYQQLAAARLEKLKP